MGEGTTGKGGRAKPRIRSKAKAAPAARTRKLAAKKATAPAKKTAAPLKKTKAPVARKNASGSKVAKPAPANKNRRRSSASGNRRGARRRASGIAFTSLQILRPLLLRLLLVAVVGLCGYGAWLDIQVRSQFEGKRWAVPAVLYARPMEVYPEQVLSPEDFRSELEASGFSKSSQLARPGTFRVGTYSISVRTRAFQFWDGREPARKVRVNFDKRRVTGLSSHSGPVPLLRVEPAIIARIYPAHREDRVLVRLPEVPELLVKALIATEDRAFWSHWGVSLKSVARAVWANLRAGRTVQGGSTLTQQLAKNFFLTSERTLTRKLREAAIALILEARYPKTEILQAYLNEVYLGQHGRRAVHGFGLAARFYFGRPLTELRTEELALLVALVRGASYYDPRRQPERAKARRDLVLEQLANQGILNPSEAARAQRRGLGVTAKPGPSNTAHPAFVDLVRRQLSRDYRKEDLMSEGLRIFTTLAPRSQAAAESALQSGLYRLSKKSKAKNRTGLQGAVVITAADSAEVLAVVGGRDPQASGFNRALDAIRPIGSLVKPAIYLAALERHGQYSLATPLDDSPVSVPGPSGTWRPRNYDGRSHGRVPLHTALSRSYNLATVRLGMALGLPEVRDSLKRLGVRRTIPKVPAVLLGALELAPLDVAQMYQTLASGGFHMPLRTIREVTGPNGRPLAKYPLSGRQVVSAESAYLLRAGLEQVVNNGTARHAKARLPAALRAGGKTGTTDDLRDSWFAGFAGDRVAVVWIGRDDNRPAGLTGSSGALRVWTDLMRRIAPRPKVQAVPEGVIWAWTDGGTGESSEARCPGALELPFSKGTAPLGQGCSGRQAHRYVPRDSRPAAAAARTPALREEERG